MEIDFSFLDNVHAASGPSNERAQVPQKLVRKCEKTAQKRDFALEAWENYQNAIKATEKLQNRIMHGLREGAPLDDLFLLAIEALGLATGDGGVMLRQVTQILEDRKKNGI